MEETISLKELFDTLKKRAFLIATITLCATVASGIISFFFLTPIYQTSTQILVNQVKTDNNFYNSSEIQTNLQLINTYSVIIKSPTVLDKVRNELKIEGDITNKINVSSEKDSQVIRLTVEDANPNVAKDIANTTAKVFQEEITKIMNVDNVTILSPAKVTEKMSPIKPKPTLNVAIAFVLGLMVSVGVAFLLEYLDNTLKTENDVENHLGLPLLGVISRIEEVEDDNVHSNNQTQGTTRRVAG